MALSKKAPLPRYRVYYTYDEAGRLRTYSISTPAENAEAAVEIVRAGMVQDGTPMDRITITGAILAILT